MSEAARVLTDVDYWLKTDHVIEIQVLDPATKLPVNISSATNLDWCVAANNTSAALLSKSIGSGVTISDGPNGKFRVSLTVANAASFTVTGQLYHEAKMTLTGTRTLVGWGRFTAHPTVLA